MKTVKQWLCMVLAVFAVCGATVAGHAVQQQSQLAQKIVRLHIRANSDSQEDQTNKLLVRDALLTHLRQITATCQTSAEAVDALAAQLPRLAQTAAAQLRSLGVSQSVTVSVCKETFSSIDYDDFSLPAGAYTALRVDIGQAEGRNWWCVVFPTLCMRASTETIEQSAAAAGFSDTDYALITDSSPQVKIKFRVLEWLSSLSSLFSAT